MIPYTVEIDAPLRDVLDWLIQTVLDEGRKWKFSADGKSINFTHEEDAVACKLKFGK